MLSGTAFLREMSPMSHENPSPQESHGGIHRRTIIKGAAWSVPVVAVAVAAPAASASTVPPARFDLVYVSGPVVNANRVARGQTPFVDFTFQNVGPDAAPNAQVTFSVPSVNNNPGATLGLPGNGVTTAGWVLLNTFQNGGRDYYTFIHAAALPVGQYTVRWAHVVGGPTNTSYTMNGNLEVTAGETNTGNNGGVRGSAQIIVVA